MSSKPEKTLLIWDVDDVLNTLMQQYAACGFPENSKKLSYGELTENPPHDLLGISKEDYLASLDRVRACGFYDLPPRPEVMAFFAECGHLFDHIVLSAVPLRFMEKSSAWVLHYFGEWIQNCLFIPSPRPDCCVKSQMFSSKAEAVGFFGPRAVLIDDAVKNVEETLSSGGRAVYFPAPWNRERNTDADVFLTSLRGFVK
ncbi:MAG: hypothetical protein IKM17_07310 [Lentisphaeria bacterium]|nr:hypothetical protein [Lentisphaeria bacterium]MBR7103317.1 hypothetical protein [Lentisphaeria bacterium]